MKKLLLNAMIVCMAVFAMADVGTNTWASATSQPIFNIDENGVLVEVNLNGATEVVISNRVTAIGDGVFEGCDTLTSVTIPNSVTNIGNYAFSDCCGLMSFVVDGGNPEYASVNGLLLSKDGTKLIAGINGDVMIPDSVTIIGEWAFEGYSSLTSVTIPSSVTSIGEGAFWGCSGLMSVTIPSSVTSIGEWAFDECSDSLFDTMTISGVKLLDGWTVGNTGSLSGNLDLAGVRGIGARAFWGCEGLTSVTIPSSVPSIGDRAFKYSGLTSVTIPSSVTSIGYEAFEYCSSLTSVTIPDSVTSIGPEAFAYCPSLAAFEVAESNLAYKSESGLLLTKDGKTLVAVPGALSSVTIPEGVVDVAQGALAGSQCQRLAIPSSLTEWTDDMVYYLEGLRSFEVAATNRALESRSGLLLTKGGKTLLAVPRGQEGSVTVPDGVVNIGKNVFAGMRSHTSVTIPESVTNISYMAFGGIEYCCTAPDPSVITNIVFLGNAPVVEDGAFVMSSDSVAYVRRGSTGWGVEIPGTWNGLRIEYMEEGPQPIFTIENGVLTAVDLNGATEATIPSSVTNIGNRAFYNCTNLTSVTIPNSVTNIGNYAFAGCSGLMRATIPNSITRIGDYAFSDCGRLTTFRIPAGLTTIQESAFFGCTNLLSFAVEDGNTTYSSIDGVLFRNGGKSLFIYPAGRQGAYVIPEGTTSMGWEPFYQCHGLTEVTIPASMTSVGSYPFQRCSNLEYIHVASGNSRYRDVGGVLFTDNTLVVFPNGRGGEYSIPVGTEAIGSYSFDFCSKITTIEIPTTVTSIGTYAFDECASLVSVYVPDSVVLASYGLFFKCGALETVRLPRSITKIDSFFEYCYSLRTIIFDGDAPDCDSHDFYGVPSSCTVYVNQDSTGWGVEIPGTWQGMRIEYMDEEDGNKYFVDAGSGSDLNSGRSMANAFRTIQRAVDAAVEGETIVVAAGMYTPFYSVNKPITIKSVDGPRYTIIDGGGTNRCATLGTSAGHTNIVLRGFTLRNGRSDTGGGVRFGTLHECFVLGNYATNYGGGVRDTSLIKCIVAGNKCSDSWAYGGGASWTVSGIYADACVFIDNSANWGAAIFVHNNSDCEMFNSLISQNQAQSRSAVQCGTMHTFKLHNCTIIDNHAIGDTAGISYATAIDSILWDNKSSNGTTVNYDSWAVISNSCTKPLLAGGANIAEDPSFVDAEHHVYWLKPESPCVGTSSTGGNMGAYGVASAGGFVIGTETDGYGLILEPGTVVEDGGNVAFTAAEIGREFLHFRTNGVFATSDRVIELTNIHSDILVTAVFARQEFFVDATNGNDGNDGLSWATARCSIISAINDALDCDIVTVTNGVYSPITTGTKKITIRSVNGAVETIIDGGGTNRCATLGTNSTHTNSAIIGFTLLNGRAPQSGSYAYGGGSYCGTLEFCIISNCVANGYYAYGGGAYYGNLNNCLIAYNCATSSSYIAYGGGTYGSTLRSCTVARNIAVGANAAYAGGTYGNSYSAYNTIIWGNEVRASAASSAYYPDSHYQSLYYCCVGSSSDRRYSGTITNDPQFVDADAGDFRLSLGSPCIDAGSNYYVTSATDLNGTNRIQGSSVDLGCFEGGYYTRVPEKVSNLTTVAGGFAWDIPAGAQEYRIYRSVTNIAASATLVGTTTETSFSDPAGIPGAVYWYWVAGVNPLGEGEWSEPLQRIYVAPPSVTTTFLPNAMEMVPYEAQLEAEGGVSPYTWRCSDNYKLVRTPSTFATAGSAQGWTLDDSSWMFNLPFAFPFYGETYGSVYVNDNGTLSFGQDVSNYYYNNNVFTNTPMIAAMWADLVADPGDVYVMTDSGSVTFRWARRYYDSSLECNFSITLYSNGSIKFAYGNGNANGGFIGISAGDGERFLAIDDTNVDYGNAQDIILRGGGLAAGLTLDDNGTISGIPLSGGTYTFTVTLSDSEGSIAERELTLVVDDNPNKRPVIDGETSPTNAYVQVGSVGVFSLAAHDPEGKSLAYEWYLDGEAIPGSMSNVYVSGSTFRIVPTLDDCGAHRLKCVVSDDLWIGMVSYEWSFGVTRDWFVDAACESEDCDGGGWTTAFGDIQDAIDNAFDGDTIYVRPGVYSPFGVWDGRHLNIISIEGPAVTIVDGGGRYRCAEGSGGNAGLLKVEGFTLRNGYSHDSGGGAYCVTFVNCAFTGNRADSYGGAAEWCVLDRCTVAGNVAVENYGGCSDSMVTNCIVWANSPANADDGIDPFLADAFNGDLRLRVGSPCIVDGVQTRGADLGAAVTGLVVSARVSGNGAVEPMTVFAAPGGSVVVEAVETGRPFVRWNIYDGTGMVATSASRVLTLEHLDGDRIVTAVFSNFTFHVDAASGDDSNDGLSWATAKATIQAAVDDSLDGERIIVNDGEYAPIATDNKSVRIESVNGAEETFIDGGGTNRCATLMSLEQIRLGSMHSTNSVLVGFTFCNGYATRQNSWNSAFAGGVVGGTLERCVITDCLAFGEGNAYAYGGGACASVLRNCLIMRNGAEAETYDAYGGGTHNSQLYNCTVVENHAFGGTNGQGYCGGVDDGILCNSIVYGNNADNNPNGYYGSYGRSIVGVDPGFVNASVGDYRLAVYSPCVDAGVSAYAVGATDLAGNPRIVGAAVDVGAFEYQGDDGWMVTFDAGEHGEIVGEDVQIVENGGTATAPVVEADFGWRLVGWSKALTNVTAALTVTALYETTIALNADDAVVGMPWSGSLYDAGSTNILTWSETVDDYIAFESESSFAQSGGTPLGLTGDDQAATYALPFSFPFYGREYRTVYPNSNGAIFFDEQNTSYNYSTNVFAAHPMIAGMWRDMRDGEVYATTTADSVTFRWASLYYNGGTEVNFSVTLYSNGTIRVSFGGGNANGGVIGISAGNGVNSVLYGNVSASLANASDVVFTPAGMPDWLTLTSEGRLSGTPSAAGDYTFSVMASDEFGNHVVVPIVVHVTEHPLADVDVCIHSVELPQSVLMPGDTVTVQYVERNIGATNVVAAWTDRIVLEGEDGTRVNLKLVSMAESLDIGQCVTNTVQAVIPDLVPLAGRVRFVVAVDANGDVEESNETNNEGVSEWMALGKKLYLTSASDSVKENVSGGVRFTVRRSGPVNEALTVTVGNSDATSASLPASVTIPAGSVSTMFTVAPIDNALVDGTRVVSVSVAADGFTGAFVPFTILDDEVPRLTVTLDKASIREGDGVITATVTREGATDEPLTVYLSGTSGSRASYPSSVVIPAGTSSVTFEISVPNNDTAQVASELTLRASSSGYTSTVVTYTVEDDDVPGVVLTIAPEAVQEGGAVRATLMRADTSDQAKAITVRLTASDPNEIASMPSSVTIPARTAGREFYIYVADDGLDNGDREITIDGSVLIESCGCSGQPSSGDAITATLGIIDNDGPALSLRADPATMKEGQNPAGYLVLSHNSTLTKDLTVRIWVDAENEDEISIPETVTIHAGETAVRIPVATLDDGVEDGGQLVSVYAEVDGDAFAPASTWLQVSDQNLPDLTVDSVETVSSVVAMENLAVTFTVTNIGFMARSGAIPYAVHIVKGANARAVSSATLVKSGTLTGGIAIGGALVGTVSLAAPELPGDYRVAVVIDPDGTISELDSANNTGWSSAFAVGAAYTATAQVEGDVFLPGETVEITGTATRANGTPAANVGVDVYVLVDGTRRTLSATTLADGSYSVVFPPTSGEAGNYTIGACYPGVNSSVAQDSFCIPGMKRGSTANIIWDYALGDSASRTVTIQNRSSVPLTGLTVTFRDKPEECELVHALADTIPANGSVTLTLTATAVGVTEQVDYNKFYAHIEAAEGVSLDFPLYFHSQTQKAYLRATPSRIDTTMAIGHTRYVDVTIVNDGKGDSGAITATIPSVDWLRIVAGASINNLTNGESAVISLALSPSVADNLTFNNPLSGGKLAVNCANGTGCSIPLKFTPVSEATGSITVDAVDNNTYTLESAPHLSNATVRVSNPYTGVTVATGKTDENGIWSADNIPEGLYQLTITAPNHETYADGITIEPERNKRVDAFLQYQLVSVSWNVEKTEIEDAYDIDLVLDFETQVPAPIVKTYMPDELPVLNEGEAYTFTVTLENTGLISAEKVTLTMPNIEGYTFTLSDNDIVLPAKSSAIITVLFNRPKTRSLSLMASGAGTTTIRTEKIRHNARTGVDYVCGPQHPHYEYVTQFYHGERTVTSSSYVSGDTWVSYGNGGSSDPSRSNGGGVWVAGGFGGGTGSTYTKRDCLPCVNSIRDALLDCGIDDQIAENYQHLFDLLVAGRFIVPQGYSVVDWFGDEDQFSLLPNSIKNEAYEVGLLANECYNDDTEGYGISQDFPYVPLTPLETTQIIGDDFSIRVEAPKNGGNKGTPLTIITDSGILKSGFQAVLFRNETNHSIVLAMRGTDFEFSSNGIDDVLVDVINATCHLTSQYFYANKLLEQVLANTSEDIIVVGHSLGGGLTQYAMAKNQLGGRVKGYTYNAAGQCAHKVYPIFKNARNAAGAILNIRNDGDPVSWYGRHLGSIYELPCKGHFGFGCHSMPVVIDEMAKAVDEPGVNDWVYRKEKFLKLLEMQAGARLDERARKCLERITSICVASDNTITAQESYEHAVDGDILTPKFNIGIKGLELAEEDLWVLEIVEKAIWNITYECWGTDGFSKMTPKAMSDATETLIAAYANSDNVSENILDGFATYSDENSDGITVGELHDYVRRINETMSNVAVNDFTGPISLSRLNDAMLALRTCYGHIWRKYYEKDGIGYNEEDGYDPYEGYDPNVPGDTPIPGNPDNGGEVGGYIDDIIGKIGILIDNNSDAVCASVTLKLSQTLAMTREAFDGTLTLYNGNTTTPITNLRLDVSVLDEDGNECKDLFEIFANGTSGDMSDGSALAGGLSVSANGTGSAMIRFIPERSAAPTEEKLYRFGGTVTYTDPFSGETATVKLTPVSLTVSPSPYLHLDYFVQRDVFADDPFTPDVVEASMPAELAVLVRNVGGGDANRVTIASAQPEMVKNEKGLSVAFNLRDYTLDASALNGATAHLGLHTVSLGTIEPNESKVAQWWLTSTLEGHFVGMSATVTPVNSWNTPDTTLVDPDVGVHKLVRSIIADGDALPDFLVCDGSDLYGKPNEIYTSAGDRLAVYVASVATSAPLPTGGEIALPITFTPARSGWNYGYAAIPGIFGHTISRIVRGDGSEIPLRNAWITDRTFRDGTTPLLEDRLHIVDEFASNAAQAYTVYLAAKVSDVPEVASFEGVTGGTVEYAARNVVTVAFSKPIDAATFTVDDLTIVKQGAYLDDLSALTIVPTDGSGTRFTIGNLSAPCSDYGRYELTVQCAGIADLDGNLGKYGKSVAWTYAASGSVAPQLVELVRRMSDGFGGMEYIASFDRDVDVETVTLANWTLSRNGSVVSLTGATLAARPASAPYQFVLSGIDEVLTQDGEYELSFSSAGVTDEAGHAASGSKSVSWRVDTTPPAQIADLAISPDGGFSDTDGVTYTGALTVTGTLPETGVTVEIVARYVGGGETELATIGADATSASLPFSLGITLPGSGNVTLVVRLTDAAGNSSETEKGVYVDGIALTGALTGASEDEGVITASAMLSLSDRVMEGDVTVEKFSLTRDGEAVALNGVTLTARSASAPYQWELSGLDALCAEDGQYVLRFDGSAVRKYSSGLTMGGALVMRWRYENPDREPPAVTEVLFDGEAPHAAYTNVFSSVSVTFSEAVNVPELIANGLIGRAARIDLLDAAGAVTGCVEAARSASAPYQWNAEANTLSWAIDPLDVPAGAARLMLDAGLIKDLAGNRLTADANGQDAHSPGATGGTPVVPVAGLRTYTLSETVLAQVNAQAMPCYYDASRVTGSGLIVFGLKWLYVGEKTADGKGKIRIYGPIGNATDWSKWSYLQSNGADIEIPAQGCQGASVALADMDGDGAVETYIGTAGGEVLKYPSGTAIASLGSGRAMPFAYDIDGDGCDELVVGGMDGKIRVVSLPRVEDSAPDQGEGGSQSSATETYTVTVLTDVNGAALTVPNGRAAPVVADINHDGYADIVSGDTAGNVWAYLGAGGSQSSATASDAQERVHPVFVATPVCVFTNSVGLADRSRLGYADMNGDKIEDIIIGRSDGTVAVMYAAETLSPCVPFSVKAVISASAGEHGVIAPAVDMTYDGGDTPVYSITPDVGYYLNRIEIDGEAEQFGVVVHGGRDPIDGGLYVDTYQLESQHLIFLGNDFDWLPLYLPAGAYRFRPLTASHTIYADFAATRYAITYTGLMGAANQNPDTYTVEDAVTFTAPGALYGWVFKGWTPASIVRGSTGSVEVVANWERARFGVTVNGVTTQYDYEEEVTFTTNTVITCGATQYVCKGWTATNADPSSGEGARAEFRVLGDVALNWQWETNVVTLVQSVNADSLDWTTGGAAEWLPEWADDAADGLHQARCGAVPNGTNAWLSTTVEGPGTLAFKWRSALASRNTKYQFLVDGEVKGMLTGTNDWTEVSFTVFGDRSHEIKWRLMTGRSGASAGDWVALDEVVWVPTVPPTLAEALNTNLVWTTEGDVLWRGVARESLTDSRDAWAVVSGLGDDGTSVVQTRVYGSGILFFDWAISCEEDYDWMELTVDGEVRDYISGNADWTSSAVEIVGDGWHVVRWVFIKDELDDPELAGENTAKLDNVVWTSDAEPPAIEETQTTPVPVPYEELEGRFNAYLERANGDYEAAAHLVGRNGYAIWESYVAGLVPDDEKSKFTAKIEMQPDGTVKVAWEPDTPELRATRTYTTYGKKTLLDSGWTPVTDANKDQYRFFKVEVKMK